MLHCQEGCSPSWHLPFFSDISISSTMLATTQPSNNLPSKTCIRCLQCPYSYPLGSSSLLAVFHNKCIFTFCPRAVPRSSFWECKQGTKVGRLKTAGGNPWPIMDRSQGIRAPTSYLSGRQFWDTFVHFSKGMWRNKLLLPRMVTLILNLYVLFSSFPASLSQESHSGSLGPS